MATKKVLIIGATGRIGGLVLEYAVQKGSFDITALARNPDKLSSHPCFSKIKVVKGDIKDKASLQNAFNGQDVIISVIGSPSLTEFTTFNADAAKAITEVVQPHQRWISLMGMSVLPMDKSDLKGKTYWESPTCAVPKWLHYICDDMQNAIRFVLNSDCKWTVVCPPHIPEKNFRYMPWFGMTALFKRTGKYRTAVEEVLPSKGLTLGLVISQEDLADYFVKLVDDDSTIQHRVTLAY